MSWSEFIRTLTFDFHKRAYELQDKYKLEHATCQSEKEAFRQRINTIESDNDDLRYENIALKKEALKSSVFSLETFKTRKLYKFNQQQRQLHQMLTIKAERDAVEDWVEANLDLSQLNGLSLDEKAKKLRILIDDKFPAHRYYTADPIPNTFTLPSELIRVKLKGNCNDWFFFIFYIYEVVFREQNKLYAVMGGLNDVEGWNNANHAYCLWHHSDNKYYVIESAIGTMSPWNKYVQTAIDAFGSVDIVHNFKYSRVIWMADAKTTYYQVVFQ